MYRHTIRFTSTDLFIKAIQERRRDMMEVQTRRLTADDCEQARALFTMMAEVFEEESDQISNDYLDRLLAREDFWAIAAFDGDEVVGGLTAHTLPMTRKEFSELFIYDIAVRHDRQREGIGRGLITALREAAVAEGVNNVFVPVDEEDVHAIDFYRALGGEPAHVMIFTFSRTIENANKA